MKPDDFNTPALPENAAADPGAGNLPLAETADVVDNSGKTDELSLAVAAEQQRNAVHIPEPVKAVNRFRLDYFLDGKKHKEEHPTVEHALASVRRLRLLGIIPATSTL